jgi:hypothetical protein
MNWRDLAAAAVARLCRFPATSVASPAAGLVLVCVVSAALSGGRASAQFIDDFLGPTPALDPTGQKGWRVAAGDGQARALLRQGGDGFATIDVDATRDRRNVWWTLIERNASGVLDLAQLAQPGKALRISARIRVSHAPRRVNLQLLTQRTTDYHSHLMEFDVPDADTWHTLSVTTPGLDARPGDALRAHLALMDWGFEKYRVDLDYVEVEVVDVRTAGPDQGDAVPYHPPLVDPKSFGHAVPVAQDGMIDLENPDVCLGNWSAREGGRRLRVRSVDAAHDVILRWDLSAFAGRRASGSGQLELTTHALERSADEIKDFGLVRVVEILGGNPGWRGDSVTAASLLDGQPLARVLNPQPIIDWPVAPDAGGKTYLTIGRPVLQRLIDGRTRGIAITPLGAIHAAFRSTQTDDRRSAPVLRFNLE